MLILSTLTAWLMMSPALADKLKNVPFCKDGSGYESTCQEAVGYLAVYRLLFAQTVFFALFAVIMVGVKSSRDPRTPLQNGFWAIKYLILIGLSVGAFFIPEAQTFGSGMCYNVLLMLQTVTKLIIYQYGCISDCSEDSHSSSSS